MNVFISAIESTFIELNNFIKWAALTFSCICLESSAETANIAGCLLSPQWAIIALQASMPSITGMLISSKTLEKNPTGFDLNAFSASRPLIAWVTAKPASSNYVAHAINWKSSSLATKMFDINQFINASSFYAPDFCIICWPVFWIARLGFIAISFFVKEKGFLVSSSELPGY